MARPFSVPSRIAKLNAIQARVKTDVTAVRKLAEELAPHDSKAHRYALQLEGALGRAMSVKGP